MGKKPKKEKVRYYDDGRSLADMSGVPGPRLSRSNPYKPRASFKEQWKTYWGAVKMMFVPMLFVIVCLGIVYMLAWVYFAFIAS